MCLCVIVSLCTVSERCGMWCLEGAGGGRRQPVSARRRRRRWRCAGDDEAFEEGIEKR